MLLDSAFEHAKQLADSDRRTIDDATLYSVMSAQILAMDELADPYVSTQRIVTIQNELHELNALWLERLT